MASRKKVPADQPGSREEVVRAHGFALVATSVVDRFGWPGVVVLFIMYVAIYWSTPEQKHRFVECYFFGNGIGTIAPIVVLAVLFASTTIAQRSWYGKKIARLQGEVDRVGAEKSDMQQERTDTPLQSSKPHKELIGGE